MLAKLLDYFLKRSKSKLIVLVGTSGDTGTIVSISHCIRSLLTDTGSSSLEAVKGLANVDIVVLFPKVLFTMAISNCLCVTSHPGPHHSNSGDANDLRVADCLQCHRLVSFFLEGLSFEN